MRKKKFIIRNICFLFLFLFFAKSAFSQKGMNSFFCCSHPPPCLHFNSQEELDRHNCDAHGIGCPNNPGSNGKITSSPISIGFAGALLGTLGGSLARDNNGKNQWGTGAAIVSGTFMTLDLLASKKISNGAKIPLGIIGGGLAGAGTGMALKAANTYESTPKPDQTLRDAGIGALVGAGIGAVKMIGKDKAKKSSSIYNMRKSDFFARMSFGFTGNGIGIIVRL